MKRLLPSDVVVAEARSDAGTDGLLPEEHAVIADAVAARQAEFATVRRCARQALAQLGAAPQPILPGPHGAPRWPDGIVGSMTHCDGYRAAAVASSTGFLGLGIDAEPHRPLPDGVLRLIARPEEFEQLSALPSGFYWDTLLFAIKEAVYKAWHPLTGDWLDFDAVSIGIDSAQNRFRAELTTVVDTADSGVFNGRFAFEADLILVAVAVPRI